MPDFVSAPVGFISPKGNYSQRNVQTLGGSSTLWQDFFTRAQAERHGDLDAGVPAHSFSLAAATSAEGEPLGGSVVLEAIHTQRGLPISERPLVPPEPLFLPKAELDNGLLPPPNTPYPPEAIAQQQYALQFDEAWARPVAMKYGKPMPVPGPGPAPRTLYLPIAEFDSSLLPPPNTPYPPEEMAQQQYELQFDEAWARPVVLGNIRLAA
ncbi:energy transducer TonB [Pseudomonas typographi]|uniref:energy transducer TonB n=1 Tax=Pseudomonas typographi TaxID=2715964 RepID=UPI0016859FEA|nr:energy transducer TonB [Pseudomonas typographi]MBD1550332.1 energy transducer TonB [Pseudomonas typographi]MBD1588925.1 energy transducer TonB [Pseudomonas typographi]